MTITNETGTKQELAEYTIVEILNTTEFLVQTSGELLDKVVRKNRERVCSEQLFYTALRNLKKTGKVVSKLEGRNIKYALKKNEYLFGPISKEPTELDALLLSETKRLISDWNDEAFNWWIEFQERLAAVGEVPDRGEAEKLTEVLASLYGVSPSDFYEDVDLKKKKEAMAHLRDWCDRCSKLFRLVRRLEIRRGMVFSRPWDKAGPVEEYAGFGKMPYRPADDDSFPISVPTPAQWYEFYVDLLDKYEVVRKKAIEEYPTKGMGK